MSEIDKILENEIGSLGGNQDNLDIQGLGKMKHVPGQQEALSEEEKASFDAFNSATRKESKIYDDNTFDISGGWIPIDRASMGERSRFYPTDWEFRIKPATVDAIKNWSSIDEENIAVVNNVMNEIMKSCVSISTPTGKLGWDKINSWDRFWFILKVREYTFAKGEQALEFDEECDNCGENLHFVLRADDLYYELPDEEVIEKHLNPETREWVVDPNEYDLPGRTIHLFIPTLQKDNAILQWLYAQSELGKTIEETFIKFLPFMLEKAPKDPTLLDKLIKDCYREYKSWSQEMFLFMDEIRRNIIINPSEKLTMKCPNCGEEVRSTVKFPNGIKYLFAVQGKHRKFGSK